MNAPLSQPLNAEMYTELITSMAMQTLPYGALSGLQVYQTNSLLSATANIDGERHSLPLAIAGGTMEDFAYNLRMYLKVIRRNLDIKAMY